MQGFISLWKYMDTFSCSPFKVNSNYKVCNIYGNQMLILFVYIQRALYLKPISKFILKTKERFRMFVWNTIAEPLFSNTRLLDSFDNNAV